jgi:hypothetical protein
MSRADPVAIFHEARAAGFRFTHKNGRVICTPVPPAELLAKLRDHKAVLVELVRGDRCRACGETLDWQRSDGVIFADGTAEHHACRSWPDGPNPVPARVRVDNCRGCRRVVAVDAAGQCRNCMAEVGSSAA